MNIPRTTQCRPRAAQCITACQIQSSKLDFRIYWPENFKIILFIYILLKKFGKSYWSESIFTGRGPPDHCWSRWLQIENTLSMGDCQILIWKVWPWTIIIIVFGECLTLCFPMTVKHCCLKHRYMYVSLALVSWTNIDKNDQDCHL